MLNFSEKNKCDSESLSEFLDSFKEYAVILEADHAARKSAGLEGKPGSYTFICPRCGSECHAYWVECRDELHGATGCETCNFLWRV